MQLRLQDLEIDHRHARERKVEREKHDVAQNQHHRQQEQTKLSKNTAQL